MIHSHWTGGTMYCDRYLGDTPEASNPDLNHKDTSDPFSHEMRIDSSPLSYLYHTIFTLYDYYNMGKEEEVGSRNIFTSCVNKVVSRNGWDILEYFRKHKVATKPEIEKSLGINYQTLARNVYHFTQYGILKLLPHKVMPPYIDHNRNSPLMYALGEYTPEDVTDAQRRYSVAIRGIDPVNQQAIVKAQNQAYWNRILTYADKRGIKSASRSEIKQWVPDIRGKDFVEAVNYIQTNHKDKLKVWV